MKTAPMEMDGNPWKVVVEEDGNVRIFKVGNTLDVLLRERGIAHLREQTATTDKPTRAD